VATHDPYVLPANLPVPEDDGAADHLVGLELPDLTLASSQGDLSVRDFTVLSVYPRSGKPGVPLLPGWDETPGARGCTVVAACARSASLRFPRSQWRRHRQSRHLRREALRWERRLGAALGLPTFEIAGLTLYKRITLVSENARIVKVFYPVFPPDENADNVLRWLQTR
jgi:peroxiredoxin